MNFKGIFLRSFFKRLPVKEAQIELPEFLESLLQRMGTYFATPEEEIIKQGDFTTDMFWISKGDCLVQIDTQINNGNQAPKLLI